MVWSSGPCHPRSEGHGHGWQLGAVLIEMIDEYALHSGQAHVLRFAALGEGVR
jgi:hypothetical protein